MFSREGVTFRWDVLTALVVGAVVAVSAVTAVQTQQRTEGNAVFAPQDYIEIQQLVARYAYAFDGGLDKGTTYADLFTTDGAFIDPRGRHEGRKQLEALGGSGRRFETPLNAAHYIVNHVIQPISATRATGKEYLVVLSLSEDGTVNSSSGSIRLGGQYRDEYEKTRQGWRFKSRQFIMKDTTETAEATAEQLRSKPFQPSANGRGRGAAQ